MYLIRTIELLYRHSIFEHEYGINRTLENKLYNYNIIQP